MSVGDRIKEARKLRRMTSLALAPLVGVHPATISHWEHGPRKPTGENVIALAKALGVSERWLVTGEGPREATSAQITIPLGIAALEAVLADHVWPSLPVAIMDDIARELRAEAATPDGQVRPISIWRHRLDQLAGKRRGSLHVARR